MSTLVALLVLSMDHIRRLLRDGVVVRSLAVPTALPALAMLAAVILVSMMRAPTVLAVVPSLVDHPSLSLAVERGGWRVAAAADPLAEVASGRALVGTDGEYVWLWRGASDSVRLESVVRTELGAGWRPDTELGEAHRDRARQGGAHLLRFIGSLFAFYGVVFGAGGIARDRDDGTLDVELALGVPMWVHPLARWAAGSTLLASFFSFSVMLYDALLGVEQPAQLLLHGAASCGAATALGLVLIGQGGLRDGFAGPMSAGVALVATFFSLGLAVPSIGGHLPMASLLTRSTDTTTPILLMFLLTAVACAAFVWRQRG